MKFRLLAYSGRIKKPVIVDFKEYGERKIERFRGLRKSCFLG
jgi:hypothetical protein